MDRVIFFFPAMKCFQCERQTHIALVSETTGSDIVFEPLCYLHGFVDFVGTSPTKQEVQAVYSSVERFVLGHFDNVGMCTVIGMAKLSEIPGYQETPLVLQTLEGEPLPESSNVGMRSHDKAFVTRYTNGEGQARYCWAVWDAALLQFVLYERE
jgi:hypothetical protein